LTPPVLNDPESIIDKFDSYIGALGNTMLNGELLAMRRIEQTPPASVPQNLNRGSVIGLISATSWERPILNAVETGYTSKSRRYYIEAWPMSDAIKAG